LQFGRSDALHPQPAYDRGYRFGEGSYRSSGPGYSQPSRGSDRYNEPRPAGEHGSRRDYDQRPSYSQESSREHTQYSHRGSDGQYAARPSSRAPPIRGEATARLYEDPRWSRGVDGPPPRGNRSPSYTDRQPAYSERPPSYAERPPSYAERPPSYADRPRAPLTERPRYEEPAYRPVPVVEYTPIIDEGLFPPPPPTRGQLAGRGGDLTGPVDGGTPKDLEREAFNAELDRLAADLDKVIYMTSYL